jgi:hypothetical protein
MKRILSYKLFEEQETTELTQEQAEWLNQYTKGTWDLNPDTGLVDIDGSFNCHAGDLIDFNGIRFGKVTGDFDCSYNQLFSLDGAPKEVGGDFECDENMLDNLEGAPESVGGYFTCNSNQLTSLKGSPKSVGRYFSCITNQLTNLEGAPENVGGSFYCEDNMLTSLVGAPEEIDISFHCDDNQLTNLIGAPIKVAEFFSCNKNQLTSLEGVPKSIGMGFYCEQNPVSDGTLLAIYKLMERGKSYQKALSEYWDQMPEEDKILMYSSNPDLPDDDRRGYELRAKVSRRTY